MSTVLEHEKERGAEVDSVCIFFAHPAETGGRGEAYRRIGFGVGRTPGRIRRVEEKLGISEEKVWLQRTPTEQAMIVYWETDDAQRTLREIANS